MKLSGSGKRYTGGCLCSALCYEAEGEPLFAGLCYCADCQKASGSAFIPFMGFASSAVRVSGPARQFTTKAARGRDAEGRTVPQDYVQAHKWFNLAGSGATASEEALRDRAARARERVAAAMTPEQTAEAQRLAREWESSR
jgi:hypothetical protein